MREEPFSQFSALSRSFRRAFLGRPLHKQSVYSFLLAAVVGSAFLAAFSATCSAGPTPEIAGSGSQEQPTLAPGSSLQDPASTPPDCLTAGCFDGLTTLCDRLGEILAAMDGSANAESLLRDLGAKLRNPTFAGVDLSAPVHFFLMNPKKYQEPWVFQFQVTDANAVAQALKRHGAEGEAGYLHVRGRQATWSLGEPAAVSLRSWQEIHPGEIGFRASGQLRLRLDVRKIMELYPEEIAAQARDMKARMRQALSRRMAKPIGNEEISTAESELGAALALLREVHNADVAIEMTRACVRISLDIKPLPGTTLSSVVQHHPKCSMKLVGSCPGDATIVVVHNIAVLAAVQNMVARALGVGNAGLFRSGPTRQSGHTVIALFLYPGGESPVEILALCDGERAWTALQRWQRLEAQDTAATGLPFALRPLPVEPVPGETLRLAEVALNESALGPGGVRALRRALRQNPRAALSLRDGVAAVAIGPSPLRRIRQVRELRVGRGQSLMLNPMFARPAAGGMDHPNLLVYVSPDGIRQWLKLAGLTPGEPGADDLGLTGRMRFSDSGRIGAAITIPTAALRRALLLTFAEYSDTPLGRNP